MNLLDRLEESPPFLLYYLCRNDFGSHPGIDELSQKSGLSCSTIERMSKLISWKAVRLDTLDRFCHAVGQDFVASSAAKGAAPGRRSYLIKPFKGYLKHMVANNPTKNPLRHLDANQRRRFFALCGKWKEARALPF